MKCDHASCGSREKVWLSYKYKGRDRGLKPHLYCTKCGLVKSVSPEKPHRLGYYINIISSMGEEIRITKVQMRLISMELARQGIDDVYGMDRHHQEELFVDIVKNYVNVSEQIVRKFLNSKSI